MEKEPLKLKLAESQLCEFKEKRYIIEGLRKQSIDIAFNIGRIEREIWDEIQEIFPETKDIRISLDWRTGEITEAKGC